MVIVKSFDFLFSAPLVAEDCKHALKNFLTRVRSTASPLALAKNFGRAIFCNKRGAENKKANCIGVQALKPSSTPRD